MDSDGNRMQNSFTPRNWGHSMHSQVPLVSGNITVCVCVCVCLCSEEVERNTTLHCTGDPSAKIPLAAVKYLWEFSSAFLLEL